MQLGPQPLDRGILFSGGPLRLLAGLSEGERDLGLLARLGVGKAGVQLAVELGCAHLLSDVGVLGLVDREAGAAMRALDHVGGLNG